MNMLNRKDYIKYILHLDQNNRASARFTRTLLIGFKD